MPAGGPEKEAAGLGLGRQVSALQSHAAIIRNLCRQCHGGCRSRSVETQSQGETWGLSAAGAVPAWGNSVKSTPLPSSVPG